MELMNSEASIAEYEELQQYFRQQLSLLYGLPDDVTALNASASTVDQIPNSLAETTGLRQRLKEKIETIQAQTGSLKRMKKSKPVRRAEKEAEKRRRRRRTIAKKQEKERPQITVTDTKTVSRPSVTFSALREERSGTKTTGKKGQRLREKFRKLNIAQKEKEQSQLFAQTGQGGVEVLKRGWDCAVQRARGEKVLDDPKRIQKSIDDTFKLKARRAKQWQERHKQETKERHQRQEKRQKNLQQRSVQRREKTSSRKSKRR